MTQVILTDAEPGDEVVVVNITDPTQRQQFLARSTGDEPIRYQHGGPEYLPNYDSIVAPRVFPEGGGVVRHPWLLDQERIWIDAWGHVHDVDLLPRDYALNVLVLVHEHLGQGDIYIDPFTCPLVQALRRRVLAQEEIDDLVNAGVGVRDALNGALVAVRTSAQLVLDLAELIDESDDHELQDAATEVLVTAASDLVTTLDETREAVSR